ncbi:MAG: TRAP transporter small permease subunit [Rhodospirillales bacterium]|jgi:TRAP-type mannitol/chloroaromatic compound transport system permease small subunit|nr:TRAP transporter small permease subunit [Rhodospirillales bacterium]
MADESGASGGGVKELLALRHIIDALNSTVGSLVAWAALGMVLVQFTVVIGRYIFGVNFIWMQESVIYLHGLVFMLGAGYTLLHDGHVRVDIWYRDASPRFRSRVDLVGGALFLLPVCILIWGFSWPYVVNSWTVLEGSMETSGIPAVFALKSLLLGFSAYSDCREFR